MCINTYWLASADPGAQTPERKGFDCRWASPPWPSFLLWSAPKVSFPHRSSLLSYFFFSPSLFLSWFASEVSSQPLPTPRREDIWFLQLPLSWLQISRSSGRLLCRWELCALLWLTGDLCVALAPSDCSLKLQCGAASDGEHSVNKARERDRAMRRRSLLQWEDRLLPLWWKWEQRWLCV